MKILRVTIQNLNSLRLTKTIDFSASPLADAGLFAITGDTGAGKTTILDAITLALYGRIHRNRDVQEVMSFGAVESLAEVEFDNGQDRFLAKWSVWRAHRQPEGNLRGPQREISRWNAEKQAFEIVAEKIREVDQYVEEVTGLDYDRFTRSVLLAQGDFAAFLRAGEKERSDLLERITGTGVYTNLSQAAFRRYREEEVKLLDLRRELGSLRILGDEEAAALEEELQRQQGEGEELASVLAQLRESLAWLQEIGALGRREAELGSRLGEIAREKEAAAADFARLDRHEKARKFAADLALLDDLHLQAAGLRERLEVMEISLREKQEEKEQAGAQYREHQVALTGLMEAAEKEGQLIEQVLTLDVEIREKSGPLAQAAAERQQLEEELAGGRGRLEEMQRQQAALAAEMEELGAWLQANRHWQELEETFPTLELKMTELDTQNRRLGQYRQSLETLDKEAAALGQEITALSKRQDDLRQEIASLAESFRAAVPDRFAQDRREVFNLLNLEMEQQGEQLKNLRALNDLQVEYQAMLAEMSEMEEELQRLQHRELETNKELMSVLEERDQLRDALAYREQVFEQQLAIANYEKDRARLREGEPCPLCFAVHHPFREHPVKPFVDNARRDLEAARARLAVADRRYQGLLARQKELMAQIESLAGGEIEVLGGRLDKQGARILESEGRIARLVPELRADGLVLASNQLLRDRLREAEGALQSGRAAREQLQEIDRRLTSLEQDERRREAQLRDLESKLGMVKQKQQAIGEQAEESDNLVALLTGELTRSLQPLAIPFDAAAAAEILQDLRRRRQEYRRRREHLDESGRRRELAVLESGQLEKNLAEGSRRLENLAADEGRKWEELDRLRNRRFLLFADKDPRQEREKTQARLREQEQETIHWRERLENANLQMESERNLKQERTAEQQQLAERVAAQEETLTAKVAGAGFASIDDLRLHLLPDAEVQRLEQQRRQLAEKETEAQQLLRDTQRQLAAKNSEKKTDLPEEELRSRIREKDHQHQEKLQRIGAIREKLEQNENRRREARELVDRIGAQQQELRRWGKLNDIIGSADGKKFRVFAQGLTLNRLVRLANRHLANLNGRYLIRKRSEEDLELEIIDTFQADNCRSMNTLSGGESFLVSLALALGLSDLAGQQTNIRSLFIDEGFGTLDENTLDLAISTLENLQAGGKTIGIISHVKELKERIATQILVKKEGNGFSGIEILG